MNRTTQLKTDDPDPHRANGPSPRREASRPAITSSHVQHVWAAQDHILGETQSFLNGWFGRRHSMAEAMGNLAAEMMEAGSDTERMTDAIARWQEGARTRVQADMRDWMTFCTNCSGHLAREASQAETEILDNTVEIARRAGNSRHATPV